MKVKPHFLSICLLLGMSQGLAQNRVQDLLKNGQDFFKQGTGAVDQKRRMLKALEAYLGKAYLDEISQTFFQSLEVNPRAIGTMLHIVAKYPDVVQQLQTTLRQNPTLLNPETVAQGVEGLAKLRLRKTPKDIEKVKAFIAKKAGEETVDRSPSMPMVTLHPTRNPEKKDSNT